MRRPLLAEGRLHTVEVPAEGAARRIEVRPGRTSGGFRRGRLGRAGGAEISGGSAWLRVGPDRPGGVGEAASCVCSPGRPEFAGPGVSEDLAGLPRRLGTKGWKGQQTGCALSSSGPPAPTSTPPHTHTHTFSGPVGLVGWGTAQPVPGEARHLLGPGSWPAGTCLLALLSSQPHLGPGSANLGTFRVTLGSRACFGS